MFLFLVNLHHYMETITKSPAFLLQTKIFALGFIPSQALVRTQPSDGYFNQAMLDLQPNSSSDSGHMVDLFFLKL